MKMCINAHIQKILYMYYIILSNYKYIITINTIIFIFIWVGNINNKYQCCVLIIFIMFIIYNYNIYNYEHNLTFNELLINEKFNIDSFNNINKKYDFFRIFIDYKFNSKTIYIDLNNFCYTKKRYLYVIKKLRDFIPDQIIWNTCNTKFKHIIMLEKNKKKILLLLLIKKYCNNDTKIYVQKNIIQYYLYPLMTN